MTYTYKHVPGYSAYDHFAREVIARAEAEGRTTRRDMEAAIFRAWKACQPHPSVGPRVDVVRAPQGGSDQHARRPVAL